MSRIRNQHGKDKDEVRAKTTEVEDLLVVRDAQRNAADVYKPPMVAEFQPS
ncbi:hypothetical protein F2Q70_00035203 [Brassica cretica]|nr:hypothetical protein F2Q70_00035203 [Brassica cretica]